MIACPSILSFPRCEACKECQHDASLEGGGDLRDEMRQTPSVALGRAGAQTFDERELARRSATGVGTTRIVDSSAAARRCGPSLVHINDRVEAPESYQLRACALPPPPRAHNRPMQLADASSRSCPPPGGASEAEAGRGLSSCGAASGCRRRAPTRMPMTLRALALSLRVLLWCVWRAVSRAV